MNRFDTIRDNNLYRGPNVANAVAVPPPNNSIYDTGFNIVYNVGSNIWGYGIAGGIPSSYCTMRLDTSETFIWYNNVSLLSHELGHCFGNVHTNETSVCINDYFVEPNGIWNVSGGNCSNDLH